MNLEENQNSVILKEDFLPKVDLLFLHGAS